MIMKYRMKPADVVEAFHFTGTPQSHADADDWAQHQIAQGNAHTPPGRTGCTAFTGDCFGLYIPTTTHERHRHVTPGDWIVCGSRGEFYPCDPDTFEATYEPAGDRSAGTEARVEELTRQLADAEAMIDGLGVELADAEAQLDQVG